MVAERMAFGLVLIHVFESTTFQADCPSEGRLSHQTRAAGETEARGKPADGRSLRKLNYVVAINGCSKLLSYHVARWHTLMTPHSV